MERDGQKFLPFSLPNNSKNQNFGKMKKTPGNIITLHKYTNTKIMIICYNVPEIGRLTN